MAKAASNGSGDFIWVEVRGFVRGMQFISNIVDGFDGISQFAQLLRRVEEQRIKVALHFLALWQHGKIGGAGAVFAFKI